MCERSNDSRGGCELQNSSKFQLMISTVCFPLELGMISPVRMAGEQICLVTY